MKAWWADPQLFRVIGLAIRAYRMAARNPGGGTAYVGEARHGVHQLSVFVGTGREAWRISQRAIEEFRVMDPPADGKPARWGSHL